MVVAIRADGVFDVTSHWPTVADLLDEPFPAAALAAQAGGWPWRLCWYCSTRRPSENEKMENEKKEKRQCAHTR
jgi:hypothetical protein